MITLTKADIGKKFITREGKLVKMIVWEDERFPPSRFNDLYHRFCNGSIYNSDKNHPLDIVSRYEPEPQPEPNQKRIVITVIGDSINSEIENMSEMEAYGILNYLARTFIDTRQ